MSYLNWFGTTFLNAAGINRTSSMQSPTYDNPDWDAYSARIERYKYCESYYENAQYDALNSLGLQRRVYGKLYTNIRGIRNPVARLVNLYADKIYPAAIDTEDLSKGAIPILAPPEIKAALIQLFAWSNWSAGKQVYVRNGEKLGDSFIKVVDLVGNRRVALEVLAPQKVKDFTADVAGNIKQIVIEYPDHDPYPLPVYNQVNAPPVRFIRTEVITGTEVTVYRDGKVVERYSNPFGFVPVVHAHFDDGEDVFIAAAQQGQGDAEVVVQVAAGREGGADGFEDAGAELLRRGLAVAARDADQRARIGLTVAAAEVGEGTRGVRDLDDEGAAGDEGVLAPAALDHHARDPACEDFEDEAMGVVIRSNDRDEELFRSDLAAVDPGSASDPVGGAGDQCSAGPFADPIGAQGRDHVSLRAARARRASMRSSKGSFSRPMIW